MGLAQKVTNAFRAAPLIKDVAASRSVAVLASLAGPSWRGLIEQRGKSAQATVLEVDHGAQFDWQYLRDRPALARLYEAAKVGQWNGSADLDWKRAVDPESDEAALLPDALLPMAGHPLFRALAPGQRRKQRTAVASWLLSQFLHGEQGALFAACQITEAVPWLDGKLYGSSQVMDEGRHVEVFQRYLTEKLGKLYAINDNLYVLVDALMSDRRWDVKFLGMQILIEGLALGAFGMLRRATREPLLRDLLGKVITDEARHVHFGVLALEEHVRELSEKERREREDWTFEVALLMRNRFLAHEFYEEFWGDLMKRSEWDQMVQASQMMSLFRDTMFKRVLPNLRRIGLVSERIRPRYQELGVLHYESGRAAPELTAEDLLEDRA